MTTLEREAELDRIGAALDAAEAGQGSAVVIEGVAGIGKSQLIRDTRALAKVRGFGRLQAVGDELEQAMPWSVVRQMVERSISRYRGDDRAALLAAPAGDALRTLDDAPGDAPAGDAAVARTLHALWWVAADLAAHRPLLITVDDAQWSDLPSLRFLSYLARRLADLPIALVVASRPPPNPTGPLAELMAFREASRIEPRPLSEAAIGELAEDPDPAVVAAVHRATGGNPFLATTLFGELARRELPVGAAGTAAKVAELGPSTISRTLLARLGPDGVRLASAAAILGSRAEPWLAIELAGLDADGLAAATRELAAGSVIDYDGDRLAFVHPVIREAVLADTLPGTRALLHGHAARLLQGAGAPAARVAAHLAAAPPGTLPDAADLLQRAAAQLLREGDAETAVGHLARARDERPHDDEIQAALGVALLQAGRAAEARDHLRAVVDQGPRPPDSQRVAALASATLAADGVAAAVAVLTDALDGWEGDADGRMTLELRLAQNRALVTELAAEHIAHLERFADVPGDTAAERGLLALAAQRARYDGLPADRVADLAERALHDGAYLDDQAGSLEGMVGWHSAVTALIGTDRTNAVEDEINRARSRVRTNGSPYEYALTALVSSWFAQRLGRLQESLAEAEAALAAVADEPPSPIVVAITTTAASYAVFSAVERGDVDAVQAYVERWSIADGQDIIPALWRDWPAGKLALAQGDHEGASERFTRLRARLAEARMARAALPWRAEAVVAAQRTGHDDVARDLVAEMLDLAAGTGTPRDRGTALRAQARVDADERVELLEQAVALLETSPARLELASALIDLGEALRVDRRRRDAREILYRGLELAADCGARPLQQRAGDALAALGDRPRSLMFSGVEGLTASERRVAELASGGRSNREIAQELFVTPKTVENHLGRVYMKLGINGRRELAGSLA